MKILLLGLSGVGKSTISKLLAKKYQLNLIEADDEVIKKNGGLWPENNDNFDDFIDEVFEETNRKVIKMDKIVYVISWMEKSWINDFYNKGFLIFEMHADFEELLKRKKLRDGVSELQRKRFTNTYAGYFETVLSEDMSKLYILSLDTTNLSTSRVLEAVCSKIR